jgi:RNA polymerase sigma factor (sigma-70 family)
MWPRRGTTWTAPPEGGEPSAEDDQTVVLRAMVDRRAFAPLYEKYLTAVYRRCAGHLRDADEAWDATGVTFHKALAAPDGFQGGSFEGWLNRIADNACNDVHRARRPRVSVDEEQAIAALDRERLEEALRKLPPRRQRIARLHLAGLKGKEISSRLGVSHDLVRQEQRRALVPLADLLGVDREGREGRDG